MGNREQTRETLIRGQSTTHAGTYQEESMGPRSKVVVVDDEPFIARAVADVLEKGGFEVATCQEWAGVAKTIRAEEPDLVLLDYNMPVLKGDSICEILKRNVANENMKIVMFSSEPAAELARIASVCGADGCIAKNTPPATLVSQVQQFIAG